MAHIDGIIIGEEEYSIVGSAVSGTVTSSDDDSQADLNIGDSNGKVIAEFKDGHIKTKSFNSREIYEKADISSKITDSLYLTDKTKSSSAVFNYAKADVTGLSKVVVSSEMVSVSAGNTGYWVVVFKNNEDTVLGGKTIVDVAGTGTREFSNVEVSIPTGTKYLLVNGTNASINTSVSSIGVVKTEILSIKNELELNESNLSDAIKEELDAIYRASIAGNFKFKDFDKAYFSWTNDDSLVSALDYKSLCDEFSYPFCPAVIWENFEKTSSSTALIGNDLVNFCNSVISNGGEILNHGTKVLTSESTDDDFYEYFVTSQNIFKKYLGFKPRGKIMHGGPNSNTLDRIKCQKYYLRYFDYADFMSLKDDRISTQYKLDRYSGASGSDDDDRFNRVKTAIDDAVANKKWIRMFTHAEMSVALVRRIFEYIQSKKTEGLADVVTWSYMFDNFGDFSY